MLFFCILLQLLPFLVKKIYLFGCCRKENVLILKGNMCMISAAVHIISTATPSKPHRPRSITNIPDKRIYKLCNHI